MSKWLQVLLVAGTWYVPASSAAPWVEPGDSGLRADVQLLADAGIIRRPVNTWPLSLPDLAQDIVGIDTAVPLGAAEQVALIRLRRLLRAEMRIGEQRYSARLGLSASPERVRHFEDSARGELEAGFSAEHVGERVAVRVELQLVQRDRADTQRFRRDGSAAGIVAGNWMVTAGWQARHWGPGWAGSLVLGNAMRPIPALAAQRLHSEPLDIPLLEWLGPWSLAVVAGRVDGFSTKDITSADDTGGVTVRSTSHVLAVRGSARPLQALEVGVSAARLSDEQGNWRSAIDLRWQPHQRVSNVALFGQLGREQASGRIQSVNTILFGIEHWTRSERLAGNLRFVVEHADTGCLRRVGGNMSSDCVQPDDRVGTGYRHRGRPMAYGIDADSQLTTVAVQLRRDVGDDFRVRARVGRLGQGCLEPGACTRNAVTDFRVRFSDIEASMRRPIQIGHVEFGAGHQRFAADAGPNRNDLRAFVNLNINF